MGSKQVLPLWVRVDLGVMPMEDNSTLSKAPEQAHYHQMHFRHQPFVEGRGYNPSLSPARIGQ